MEAVADSSSLKISKRPHRKSKLGCKTCKKRKIKCDELRPACRNCVRHLVACDFLKIHSRPPPPTSPARDIGGGVGMNIALPRPSTGDGTNTSTKYTPLPLPLPLPPADQALNFVDLELIHNFTTSVYATLSTDPVVRRMWRVSVVRLALRCEYVMRALLSVSALHLAHRVPERKEALVSRALLYHRLASREAMELMNAVDERNTENLLLFSLLTIFFALASGRYLKESVVTWESAFPDWTFLLSGATSLIRLLNDTAYNESRKPIIRTTYDGLLTPIITHATERFHAARKQPYANPDALEELRRLIGENCADAELLAIYELAIDELRHPLSLALRSGDDGAEMDILDMFIWKYFVTDDFLPLLRNPHERQEAVAIYAHFCIVLKRLESQWWLQGWATHLISQAWELLDENHKPWIRWPMEEVGWAPPV
ncbi:C6 zinc finger protein [Colletotrichum sojae]|uniref:C6 zinc finger protein n=1 Tax=Colletotrichum sojae TaxID=2175907 RepID=A0A8H6IRX7_9PEZI|nr:C6 zinc finger protein [Colletotrichum sojae]